MSEPNDASAQLLDHMQRVLWYKLNNDLRQAINGYWSIAAESTVHNIVWLARHQGVLSAGHIQVPLLKGGVYHAVCELVPTKAVVDFDLSRYEQYWGNWEQLAKSVAEIRELEVEEFTYDE
jgi:hypothetical protein